MASKKQGVAIDQFRAGYGGLKQIVPGEMQIKHALAVATTTNAREGVTLEEARVRLVALGMPLWFRTVNRQELSWITRQPGTSRSVRRGVTHSAAHNAKKGAIETCVGGHAGKGSACDFEFKSVGDGVPRYRNDPGAHNPPAFDGNASATVKAAREAMRGQLATLVTQGFSAEDMRATQSIAWALSDTVNIATEAMLSKPKRGRKSAAKSAEKPEEEAVEK